MDEVPETVRQQLLEQPSMFVEKVLNEGRPASQKKTPFDYQKNFLDAESGNRVFVAGRQVGKTLCLTWYALWKAVMHPETDVLIFLPSQRQAIEFFDKKLKAEIKHWLEDAEQYGIVEETKSTLRFSNGSRMIALPAANTSGTGATIRMYTADCIIVDEAGTGDIPDEFFKEVLYPMLLTTQGDFILSGTPWGRSGYFYEKWRQSQMKHSHWFGIRVSTMENPLVTPEMLEEFKEDMTRLEYQREILGEFTEKENAAFPVEDIRACKYVDPGLDDPDAGLDELKKNYPPWDRENAPRVFLGVDVARFGQDNAVFTEMDENGNVFNIDWLPKSSLTQVENKVREMHDRRGYTKIIVDESGLGAGTFENLKADIRCVEGITFTQPSKMELFQCLRKVMEDRKIVIPDEPMLIRELENFERDEKTAGKILFHAPKGDTDDFVDSLALVVFALYGKKIVERATEMFNMTDTESDSGKYGGFTFEIQ